MLRVNLKEAIEIAREAEKSRADFPRET